jgi:hypothetical protein
MRRLLTATLSFTLLWGASASNAASPQAWAGSYQVAEAIWIVRDGSDVEMYMAFVENLSGPKPKARTAVFLGKGPCRTKPGHSPRRSSCSVKGRFRKIAAEDFEIDPSLGGANLSLKGARVRWTDAGVFRPDYSMYDDLPFLDVEAELARSTRAAGRILGVSVHEDDRLSAKLAQGVFGGTDPLALKSGRLVVRIPLLLSPATAR